MPRQFTQQRGPRDEVSKKKPAQKRKSGKILNALSIAEAENPTRAKIRRNRLGDDDDYFKRKRDTDRDEDDSHGPGNKRRRTGDDEDSEIDSNEGSDGEGHKWKIGVDSDNDSELDSDEAMGSSDEERFEGFTFRGSSTFQEKSKAKKKQKPRPEREINLSEGEDSDADEDMEDDDSLGEDAIDLVAAWDMNAAEEEAEAKKAAKSKKQDESEESDEEASESEDESESDDEDGSELSLSDDDLEDEDGLSKLQSFVDSMRAENAKPAKKTKSGEEHLNPSEFGLPSTRKLTVADLLPSVTDSRLKNSLKHVDSAISEQKTSSGIPGKLDAPLAKRQQDRLEREAAYEKSKETLSRWIETVKANRRAEHLIFPLPDPDAQVVHRMGVIKPQTSLENTIQDILVESGLADKQGKSAEDQVQEFEELQARKIPIEEIRARRAELRKHRDLMFREEVRAKRIKKIKSKSYRRVHRKEQERMEQKERQALLDAGIDLDEQDREKNERLRAEARMGNKHKESKWAKSLKQTGRTAWDEDARHGALELAQREEELRQRIEGKRVTRGDDDYLGSSSESESEDENPWEEQDSDSEKRKLLKKLNKIEGDEAVDEEFKGPHAKLLSMKFMQNAEAVRKAANDAEIRRLNRELQGQDSQSEAESEEGRRKFGVTDKKTDKGKKQVNRNEFEEAPGSDEEPERDDEQETKAATTGTKTTSKANDKPRAPPKPEPVPQESDAEEENPWLMPTSEEKRRSKVDDVQPTIDITPDAKPPKPAKSSKKTADPKTKETLVPQQSTMQDDDTSDDEAKVPVLLKNHDLVKRAFAGDEVVQEFEQEKLDTIEDEGDKVIDETLPGWGSWTGDGISRKERKRQKRVLTKVEGVKPENRKDAKLSRVIINEKRIKKNNKYLATQLPHPFESKQQYERSLRVPIGPEWSTKETFQSSTKPRVMIKQGVIKPMEKPMV